MKVPLRILIIDDDAVDRTAVRRALRVSGSILDFTEAVDAKSAIALLESGLKEKVPFDCIFLDYRLPDRDGLAVLKTLREMGIKSPLVVLTGQGDEQIAVEVMKAGATDYLPKSSVSSDRLSQTLHNAMRIHNAEIQAELANQRLQESYEQLRLQNQKLEEIALERQDFISHLTHDLRTPLVAADMMLKLFQKEMFGSLSPEMHEALIAMVRSNQVLMDMVNTLLEIHCYEAGSKTFTFIVCNLAEIVSEVVQELQPLAREKGIILKLEANPNQIQIMGDRLELRRMVTNLIGNSIKFTDIGYVEVNLETAQDLVDRDSPDQVDQKVVIFTVKDTGFGMSRADQSTLFQRFRKGSHKQSGSGLGLHLVQRIVNVHQGTISVSSELGKGSLFTIQIPLIN
jgi:two-component system, sensor histidine kinase and response regulator